MRFAPHDYQLHAIERILRQPAVGLLLDMGLGKTVITLSAIEELLYGRFEVNRVLVVAPLRVARFTWAQEAQKWEHLRHLRMELVLGGAQERLDALARPADVYVINRENVPWLVEHYGCRWPFDMVVLDELSSFKSAKSQRFRALRKVRPLIKRVVGLTGTPTPNGLIDLWPQVYLLDRGERLGKTLTGYRDEYFKAGRRNGHIVYEWQPKTGADKAIYGKLDGLCMSMTAADYLHMPERIDRAAPVYLSGEAMTLYEDMERKSLLELEAADIIAPTAATLTGKLLQMANGAIYDDASGVHELHDHKLDALEDIIEAANGRPVLVYYAFRHDAERIARRFEVRRLETQQDVDDWNAGRIPVLLAHPASAGHGLNLQDGGHHIVWFGLTWSLELYQQANARLHRQGQQHPVIVQHLVAQGTVDEDVMAALSRKDVTQAALIDALKARMLKYREVAI